MITKLGFVARCHFGAAQASYAIFDSIGSGRARPKLPGLKRPYAVWMCGIEAWEGLTPAGLATFRNAEIVLAISQYTRDRFERLHGKLPHIEVCWLGTEDEEATPMPSSDRPSVVLSLSRIERSEGYKGHAELIDAWPRIVSEIPNAKLVLAGGGSGLTALREMASHSTVAEQIETPGFIPQDQLDALWCRATVFAMPSRGEGFGLVYAEAMRRGIPVIASCHDAGAEVNVDAETGYNVDLRDADALPHRLIDLLSDRQLASTMGAAGQARWRAHFRFSAFQERLLRTLRQHRLA